MALSIAAEGRFGLWDLGMEFCGAKGPLEGDFLFD
jgi:hypothetical protein